MDLEALLREGCCFMFFGAVSVRWPFVRMLHTLHSESLAEIMMFSIISENHSRPVCIALRGFRHSPRQDC